MPTITREPVYINPNILNNNKKPTACISNPRRFNLTFYISTLKKGTMYVNHYF